MVESLVFHNVCQLSNILDRNPLLSLSLKIQGGPDKLLSYTAYTIQHLIKCSNFQSSYQHMLLPNLNAFIFHIYRQCHLTPTVFVIALIYLRRLKKNLNSHARGEYDTHYKFFLAAVIVASKYTEDCVTHAPSIYRIVSPLYIPQELNAMERSFLSVLQVIV
ncbi:cyclin domain-containing protein [Spinellus fusiger]|nr:cyclin domain-containing protein [Spinellus fusiger]